MISIALFFLFAIFVISANVIKFWPSWLRSTAGTYVKTTCIMSPMIPLCRSGYSEVSQIALRRHSLPGFPELKQREKSRERSEDGRTEEPKTSWRVYFALCDSLNTGLKTHVCIHNSLPIFSRTHTHTHMQTNTRTESNVLRNSQTPRMLVKWSQEYICVSLSRVSTDFPSVSSVATLRHLSTKEFSSILFELSYSTIQDVIRAIIEGADQSCLMISQKSFATYEFII